jgi:hypothetical protein
MEIQNLSDVRVWELAMQLAMDWIKSERGLTIHTTRRVLRIQAAEMIRSDPKWIEQAKRRMGR